MREKKADMLYLARNLLCPNGEIQHNMVVECTGGVVTAMFPFCSEVHSMLLVDEVFISPHAGLGELHAAINGCEAAAVKLYAYVVCSGGKLQSLG